MKGLSLIQPWASLVAMGAKKIETRSWATGYTGPIAIHAAKTFPTWAQQTCYTEPFNTDLLPLFFGNPHKHRAELVLPLGAIVAVAELIQCISTKTAVTRMTCGSIDIAEHEYDYGDFTLGRYAWPFVHVRCLPEPIPCKGAPGLWDVPTEIESQINEVLKR